MGTRVAIGSLWIEQLLYHYRDVLISRVVVHPALSKDTSTRSAEAFQDETIARFSLGEKRPKMKFWPLKPSITVSLFLI